MLGHIILGRRGKQQEELILPEQNLPTIISPASTTLTPLMLGRWGIKKYYRLLCRKQIPGQGKGLSEGVSSVCLIERCVVNCLCVGGEKSICFLAAVTSRPWGERLELADTDRHTHTHCTHMHSGSAKNPQNHALQA